MDLFPWNLVERRFFFILNSIWILILISFKMSQRNDRNLPSLNSESYLYFNMHGHGRCYNILNDVVIQKIDRKMQGMQAFDPKMTLFFA